MSIDDKQIGQRMRARRTDLGLTAAQVAEDLNFSLEHYRRLENGTRNQTLDVIAGFAIKYHVSTDYLIFGESRFRLIHAVLELAINLLMSINKM